MKTSHFFLYLFVLVSGLFGYYEYKEQGNLSNQKPIPIVTQLAKSFLPSTKVDTKPEPITLFAVGDIMLGRSVNTKIQKQKDFTFPFQKINNFFQNSDIVLVNLESPFGQNCPQTDTGMVFCADKNSVLGLKGLFVTHTNLANNHIDNQGIKGIDFTKDTLLQNQITPVGLSTGSGVVVSQIKNTKVAFLGLNDVPPFPKEINNLSKEILLKQLELATKSADIVVVSFHWGNEYQSRSKRQQEFAHLAIDKGADLIIGHHPHWVQEIENYKGVPIFYSLGNFVFDQMWSQKTREGLIAKVIFENNKVSTYSATPIFINKDYQPEQ